MMAEDSAKTIDTAQSGKVTGPPQQFKPVRGALDRVKREIKNSDLTNPAVGKMLLGQNDEYKQEISRLRGYEDRYHEADKRAGVCAERLKALEESVGSKSVLLLLTGIVAGFTPSLYSKPGYFWFAILVAVILFFLALNPFQIIANRNGKK